jgi:hypothetical protein
VLASCPNPGVNAGRGVHALDYGFRMDKVTSGSCVAPTTSEKFALGHVERPLSAPKRRVDEYVYGPGGVPLEQAGLSARVATATTGGDIAGEIFDTLRARW